LKLQYKSLNESNFSSVYAKRKKAPYFGVNWHFHDEFELMYIIKGEGVRIVGDRMDYFNKEELVFLGSGVPHVFKNDKNASQNEVDYIVVKFNRIIGGQDLFKIPELAPINRFLKRAGKGLIFSDTTVMKLKKQLIKLAKSKNEDRIILLLKVLKILSAQEDYNELSTDTFLLKNTSAGEDRTKKVINYISENYNKNISLEDLASISYMTTNSFCRYFKNRTGKTAFQFIREFRINKACQMLINGEKNISQICFDTGFNSLSSFNRVFKSLKQISATEYKSKYSNLTIN
jgi:AraC-like DNA-binding protein